MRFSLVILVGSVAWACGDSRSGDGGEPGDGKPLPTLEAFSYKDGKEGLSQMMDDLVRAAAEDDRARADMLARSLELARYDTWFREVFGAELGPKLAEEYAPLAGRMAEFARLIDQLVAAGQTEVTVEQFDRPDDPSSVVFQSEALESMIRAVPLYSVRLATKDGTQIFHIWSFAYQDGWFRWIGKTKAASREPPKGDNEPREYRIRDSNKIIEAQPKRKKAK